MIDPSLPPPSGSPLNQPPDDTAVARLAQQLQRAASTTPVMSDWSDLTGRVRQSNRRRVQGLAGMLGVVALAGPTLGFVVGRSGGSGGSRVVAGPAAEAGTNRDAVFQSPIERSAGSIEVGAWSASGPDVMMGGPVGPPTYQRLFVETIGQYTVRVFRYDEEWMRTKATSGDGQGWTPPADCFPTAQIIVEVSDDNMVAQTQASIGGSAAFGGNSINAQPVGVSEGAPAWLVVGAVPAGATAAKVTTPVGTVDALVRDGVLIAIQPAPGLTWATVGNEAFDNLTIDTGSGPKSISELQIGAQRRECEPPPPPAPALPTPGKNQPADPTSARSSIEQSVRSLIDGDRSADEQAAVIEGRRSDDPEVAALLSPEMFGRSSKSASASLTDVVFIDRDRAVGLVAIDVGVTVVSHQFVEFHLSDGVWKATRATWCQLLQFSGQQCADLDYTDLPSVKYGEDSLVGDRPLPPVAVPATSIFTVRPPQPATTATTSPEPPPTTAVK